MMQDITKWSDLGQLIKIANQNFNYIDDQLKKLGGGSTTEEVSALRERIAALEASVRALST